MAQIEIFARTEVGCIRERNEDAFLVFDLATGRAGLLPEDRIHPLEPPGTVFAVCDGMGGAAAGDVASKLAAESLQRVTAARGGLHSEDDAEAALLEAFREGNAAVAAHANAVPDRRGMGTTMTAAIAMGHHLVLGHVGDSRAYLRRGRALERLTRDHSTAPKGAGVPESDVRSSLLQALGVVPRLSVDLVRVTLAAGDVVLLCSDGLTDMMTDEAILTVMTRNEDPMRCCRALTESACAAGGPDNVTAVVARITGRGLPVPESRGGIEVSRRSESV